GQARLVLTLLLSELRGGGFQSRHVPLVSICELLFKRSVFNRRLGEPHRVVALLRREFVRRRRRLLGVLRRSVAECRLCLQQVLPSCGESLLDGVARPELQREPGIELHLPRGGSFCPSHTFAHHKRLRGLKGVRDFGQPAFECLAVCPRRCELRFELCALL